MLHGCLVEYERMNVGSLGMLSSSKQYYIWTFWDENVVGVCAVVLCWAVVSVFLCGYNSVLGGCHGVARVF